MAMNETTTTLLLMSISRVSELPAPESQGVADIVLLSFTAIAFLSMTAMTIGSLAESGSSSSRRRRRSSYMLSSLLSSYSEPFNLLLTLTFALVHIVGVVTVNGHLGKHGEIPAYLRHGSCTLWIVWIQYGAGFTPWITMIMLRLFTFAAIYDRRFHKYIHSPHQLSLCRMAMATAAFVGALLVCILVSSIGGVHDDDDDDDAICSLTVSGKSVLVAWILTCVGALAVLRALARDSLSGTMRNEGNALRDLLLVGIIAIVFCYTLTVFNALVWRVGRVLFTGTVVFMHLYTITRLVVASIGKKRRSTPSPSLSENDEIELLDASSASAGAPMMVRSPLTDESISSDLTGVQQLLLLTSKSTDISDEYSLRKYALRGGSIDQYELAAGTPMARVLFFNFCIKYVQTIKIRMTRQPTPSSSMMSSLEEEIRSAPAIFHDRSPRQTTTTTMFGTAVIVEIACKDLIDCWFKCEKIMWTALDRDDVSSSSSSSSSGNSLLDELDQQVIDVYLAYDTLPTYLYPSNYVLQQLEGQRNEFRQSNNNVVYITSMIAHIMKFVLATLVENVSHSYQDYHKQHEQRYRELVKNRLKWLDDDDGCCRRRNVVVYQELI